MSDSENRLLLIDGHALIYRAFYAFPSLTTKEGKLVNAVYGFARVLLTVLRDQNPKYIAVAFDTPKPTFRHTDFVAYKAQRKEMPETLRPQIEEVKRVVEALNIPQFAIDGYEADDVIGTLATQVTKDCGKPNHDTHVLIVTGDKDSFQLVNDCVHVLVPANGKKGEQEFDAAAVKEKMGISPEQIVDYKALAGDPSDNIPGVPGIGAKTAVRLLQEYGTIDQMYKEITDGTEKVKNSGVLKGATLRKIVEGYDSAKMSQKLATIDKQVPIEVSLEDCRVSTYEKDKAMALFNEYGFKSLHELLPADDFENDIQGALW